MKMQIAEPLADLRREPRPPSGRYVKDPLQETQLLYGETIILQREEGPWAFVEAPEQPKRAAGKWGGYPGWLLKRALAPCFRGREDGYLCVPWAEVSVKEGGPLSVSLGTSFQIQGREGDLYLVALANGAVGRLPKKYLTSSRLSPEEALQIGKSLAGDPYHWGGRSAYYAGREILTGLDCSALVQLLYRLQGVQLPRDAEDQFLRAELCRKGELVPGDPLFSMTGKKIDHVMLYAGGGRLLESSMGGGGVRLASLEGRGKLLYAKFLTKSV